MRRLTVTFDLKTEDPPFRAGFACELEDGDNPANDAATFAVMFAPELLSDPRGGVRDIARMLIVARVLSVLATKPEYRTAP